MTLFDDSHETRPGTVDGFTPFTNGEFTLTITEVDGALRIPAFEVARSPGFRDTHDMLRTVPAKERGITHSESELARGGPDQRSAAYLTEAGFYRVLGQRQAARVSDKTARELVERFQEWVFGEVLPAVRRTGSYSVPAPREELDELEVAERYVAALKRNRELEQANAELAPAADAWSKLADARGDMLVADAAKILDRDPTIETGQKRLFATLLNELHWCYRGSDGAPRAMQEAVNLGRLTEKPQYRYNSDGERVLAAPQVRVTVKGLHDLHKRLKGSQPLAIEPARSVAVSQ